MRLPKSSLQKHFGYKYIVWLLLLQAFLSSIFRRTGADYSSSTSPNHENPETRARKQGSNPKPGFLWAARPVDCGTACPLFSGIEPPQADTECIDPCSKKRKTKEIIAPNGGTAFATISINLESTPATNQEPTQERGTGPQPSPMTLTLKQDNQAAKSSFLTNERTPRPSAILPPLDPSTQFPRA
ncbi:hypothetical protein DSO57_1024726 [Entomophthora muscae]|uniref:Uncharacterized protein n=1 Tax=Entomophthora muscae TaxID=34485 RepID=A0ACC2TDN9_9FUNG|nr:hypothetical protein DSO57_1024726 [Entomophthora muscae]